MLMRSLMIAVATCVACQGWLPTAALAQTEAEIEKSRLRGLEYIKTQQLDDGSWFYEGHVLGITSLCAMALIENGTPVTDPLIEKAHKYVRQNHDSVKGTYDIALAILFLSRVGDRDSRTDIRTLAAKLVCGQNVEGGWSYTCPQVSAGVLTNAASRPDRPAGPGDNSCTQFAVLGLWVASRWGVPIDDVMEKVGDRFAETQNDDGGWPYRIDMEEQAAPASKDSMTFAGLFCLTVARATKIRSEQETTRTTGGTAQREETPADSPDAGETLLANETFANGLKRAGQYAGGISQGTARYTLWSIERMGVMLGLEKFGDTDWFAKGASGLIKVQAEDGSWKNSNEAWGALADTSFAVLFLRKANLGSDISRLLNGEPELRFQIVNRDGKPRYATLVETLAAAQAGDTIRVDGNGPFDMPHIEIDKDLTIEAGFGYLPVFRYDIGYEADGRRSRPEDDPNARHLVRINKGTLSLEGLELQMDPPVLPTAPLWQAVVLNGGNLRMLNCKVSESNEQGMAGLQLVQPCDVWLRNCILVGGRAGIEAAIAGKQSVRLENSVIFSKYVFSAVNGAGGADAELALDLGRSTFQGREIFSFRKLTLPVNITSRGCAYKGDAMGTSMLRTATGHEGLTWTGSDNIYDALRWIGAAGSLNAKVDDAKTWNTFWGGSDEKGQSRSIPFTGRRQQEAFSHSVDADDFSFADNSALNTYRRSTGIESLEVGPGRGYSRYRESFSYRAWKNGGVETAAN